jgi:hypothetical protein
MVAVVNGPIKPTSLLFWVSYLSFAGTTHADELHPVLLTLA